MNISELQWIFMAINGWLLIVVNIYGDFVELL